MDLSDWMLAEGVDDEEMGRRVEADRVTISRIRRRLNRPSWMLAAKIKEATDGKVTADDFLPSLDETPTAETAA